jgi:hypothetical protein
MAELFTPTQPQAQRRNWMPIMIGLIAVLAIIGFIIVLTRHHGPTGPQTNPYAAKLPLSKTTLSAAENYVGGTVTYLDVNITNTGDRALAGADMKAVFKNSLDQVVQTETLPIHVLAENQMGGYPDLVDLGRSPIGPGQTKTVRVAIEHISADWNLNYPEIQLVNLKLK